MMTQEEMNIDFEKNLTNDYSIAPNRIIIRSKSFFLNECVKYIPDNIKIDGSLSLNSFKNLKYIGKNLQIGLEYYLTLENITMRNISHLPKRVGFNKNNDELIIQFL